LLNSFTNQPGNLRYLSIKQILNIGYNPSLSVVNSLRDRVKSMPIYDYQCTKCGFKQEVMRKVSAPSVEACPTCHELSFAKQVSAPSFQLTGSGWYATDFKSKNTSTSAKPDESTSAPSPAACAPGCGCH
jgi:putative FmdB family regulatory protein